MKFIEEEESMCNKCLGRHLARGLLLFLSEIEEEHLNLLEFLSDIYRNRIDGLWINFFDLIGSLFKR